LIVTLSTVGKSFGSAQRPEPSETERRGVLNMPEWDLSVEQLPMYAGTNPRPTDFNRYWETALEDLAAQPADVVVEPVDLGYRSADCSALWFSGIGGARIHAKYLRPTSGANGAAIAVFHGYTWRSPDWYELIPFVAEGYTVLAMDCRGQGGQSEDVGDRHQATFGGHIIRGLNEGAESLLYRSIFTDAARSIEVMSGLPGVDQTRLGVFGQSQGGALALVAAALVPRVAAAAVAYPFLCDYRRVWDLELVENAYGEIREWLRRYDPRHERIDETFERLGYIDVQHLASRIQASVLMFTGLSDRICPPSTQFAAYNKITAPKSVSFYPDFGHEPYLPGMYDAALDFLRSHLS
jgi:cephalosporin-C deacetylase